MAWRRRCICCCNGARAGAAAWRREVRSCCMMVIPQVACVRTGRYTHARHPSSRCICSISCSDQSAAPPARGYALCFELGGSWLVACAPRQRSDRDPARARRVPAPGTRRRMRIWATAGSPPPLIANPRAGYPPARSRWTPERLAIPGSPPEPRAALRADLHRRGLMTVLGEVPAASRRRPAGSSPSPSSSV